MRHLVIRHTDKQTAAVPSCCLGEHYRIDMMESQPPECMPEPEVWMPEPGVWTPETEGSPSGEPEKKEPPFGVPVPPLPLPESPPKDLQPIPERRMSNRR
jgi:hypothetical protein